MLNEGNPLSTICMCYTISGFYFILEPFFNPCLLIFILFTSHCRFVQKTIIVEKEGCVFVG